MCGGEINKDEIVGDSIICPHCCLLLKVVIHDDGRVALVQEDGGGEDDGMWDILVDNIINGEVIPVIGEDIMLDGPRTVKEILINSMTANDKITPPNGKPFTSYSQLIYDTEYKKDKDDIYGRICDMLKKYQNAFRPSSLLTRILSIKYFPFVITTSTDSLAERTMHDIWSRKKRDIKTLVFNNDPKQLIALGDLSQESDIDNPTIYYMFGKADTKIPHRFVVTDEDMLSFCQSWMSEDRTPKILSKVLGQKYLLFLGCNYPDWLVRFIWYSMRSNLEKSGMLVGNIEKSLEEFMNRVHIKTQNNPEYVIGQIENKLAEKINAINISKFDQPVDKTDVFISYSRTDEKYAKKLYDTLSSMGLDVWYDRKNLAAGDRWLEKIKKSIESSKFCLILLSESMISQANESHVYRKEWNMAIEHAKGMGSKRGFIIPVSINELNIYDSKLDLPEGLTAHNSLCLNCDADYEIVAESILKRINDLSK